MTRLDGGSKAKDYWMTWDGKDLAVKLMAYDDMFYGASYNPIWQMWQRNLYAYYSTILDAQTWLSSLQYVGDQGELVKMGVPQARSLIRQLVTLTTKQKLAFNCIALVENTEVTEEIRIGNALAAQFVKDQSMDLKTQAMVEDGLVVGCGFLKTIWRSDLGKPAAIMTAEADEDGEAAETVVYEGDVECSVPKIDDIVWPFENENWEDNDWVKVRVKRNRWTMAAQHPDLAEGIRDLPSAKTVLKNSNWGGVDNDDMIFVYEMFHRPTPALPKGRMLVFSDQDTLYYDDINPYECIPVEQFKPEPIKGIGYGYPMLSNLLPAQEMYDHEFSCVATNHSGLGVNNVAVPKGAGVGFEMFNGMNLLTYTPMPGVPGGGAPTTLDMVKGSGEAMKFAETLLANMQQISNVNAAVRGDLPAGSSGVAIATLTTNALEFLSSYSKSMNEAIERTVMHALNAYRRFAKTERLVRMTGKNYQIFSKAFTGSQLAPITAVEIQQTNPLMATMAGRIDIADKAMEKGLVTNMQEYSSILDGAPLSQLFEADLSQNDLIHSENEALAQAQPVMSLSIDNHPLHILKHKSLLNDPKVRLNSQVAGRVQAHILEHLELAKTTDPMLMAMANTGRMPDMAAMGALPGGAPPPGPENGGGAAPAMGNQQAPTDQDDLEARAQGFEPTGPQSARPADPAKDLLGRR